MKEKGIFKSIIKYVFLTLLGFIILVNAVSFVHSVTSDRPGKIIGRFMKVETGSMEPGIGEGDLVFVVRAETASLSPGDAVTVILDGKTVTHRLQRVCEGELITKGDENEKEDSPVPLGDYLGKVVFVIPHGAVIYEILTSPGILAATALLLAVILFTGPAVKIILQKQKKFRPGLTRIGAFAAAASFLLVTPGSTLARYSATLEGEKGLSAAEVNFSSNYLTESGNRYDIIGWNGSDYVTEIKIENSSNLLKCNADGVDVSYTLKVEKILSDAIGTYSGDYSLVLQPRNREHVVESDGIRTTETLAALGGTEDFTVTSSGNILMSVTSGLYTLNGGEEVHDLFTVTANARPDGGELSLSDGQVIKYRVTAETLDSEGYLTTLYADYSLTVTTANNFIEKRQFDQSAGTQLVKLTMKSATILGMSERKVVIEWDPDLMYLNEYEINTLRMIANGSYDFDKENGKLTFNMKASSSVAFEFYKKSNQIGKTMGLAYQTLTEGDETYEYFNIIETQ